MRENTGVSDESLERRVTAVEAEVAQVRREAAAARALAAGADRDVADYRAEMRAHTRGLEALRQTQIEHYAEHKAEFAKVHNEFAKIYNEFAKVNDEFARVNTGIGRVEAGVQHLVRLLDQPGDGPGAPNAVS
jgi:septal ring factor EnvC (AmiA/AmiB activator)